MDTDTVVAALEAWIDAKIAREFARRPPPAARRPQGEDMNAAGCARRHQFDVREKYNELIMAVATKFPDETRHQTALRYINDRETRKGGAGGDAQQQKNLLISEDKSKESE